MSDKSEMRALKKANVRLQAQLDEIRGAAMQAYVRDEVGEAGRGDLAMVRIVKGMPKSFVLSYGGLYLAGSGRQDSPKASTTDQPRMSNGGKKFGSGRDLLGDERAIATRRRVDATLRKLARQINAGEVKLSVKCSGCGRFAEDSWSFCPGCATSLHVER